MNRLEMIYQDDLIEIYVKETLLNTSFYVTNNNKVIARYYGPRYIGLMTIEVKNVRFEHLKKFHDVVIEYLTKAL